MMRTLQLPRRHAGVFFACLVWGLFVVPVVARAQERVPSVAPRVEAFDMPGDAGDSIGLRWPVLTTESSTAVYRISLSKQETGEFTHLAEFGAGTHHETDLSGPWWVWGVKRKDVHFFQVKSTSDFRLERDTTYFFQVTFSDGPESLKSAVVSAAPHANLLNWAKLNNLGILVAFAATLLVSIRRARVNSSIFLRRIPGLDAVEEAVGRATEMGRPVLYLTGSGDFGGSSDPSSLATIAATVILSDVAKRVATYGAELKVPHRAPIVMAVCQEMVREAYFAAGRPDAYREDTNFFISGDQFAYTAAVDGLILREKPAANFFMGYYYAESLLLAETGATTGAIQIAGTDAEHQLPFFITTCDYTLIGEELYAASAYLSREPVLVGTLRGQDIGKGVLLCVMVIGTVAITLGEILAVPWIKIVFQVFTDMK